MNEFESYFVALCGNSVVSVLKRKNLTTECTEKTQSAQRKMNSLLVDDE